MKSKLLSFIIKYGLLIGGLFMLLISLIIINNGFKKKQITKENKIVTVKVIESPTDCDNLGRRRDYCKLKFNGQIFVKNVNRIFCELVVGKKEIKMLTNEKKDELVFPNEYENSKDFLYGILLVLFAIVISYKGWKNKNVW
ncbi:hypothetical protein V8G61_11125 [Gaetbulibacter sp. M240]|uniref:hypothetical protein n=1 Tax=Gaetbulibacter sp. M240 TaxID=3126511 RepID=UPI00374E766D